MIFYKKNDSHVKRKKKNDVNYVWNWYTYIHFDDVGEMKS